MGANPDGLPNGAEAVRGTWEREALTLTTCDPGALSGPLAGSRGSVPVGGPENEAPEALGYLRNCRH